MPHLRFTPTSFCLPSKLRRALKYASVLLLLTVFSYGAEAVPSATPPLPQDSGVAGLKQMLVRLHTTARLMHTTAHPDDEDGGMLVLESRGHGADVLQLTLNRGEGGQNRTGSNLFDVLGVVRTLELLAADRYYGVHQRFTRVADFGFSKSAEETFEKWHGHDTALRDMVRVIRTFRPDVIVSRFQGNQSDGHGHHQAAGILTREAFRAAADPNRFPEQIKEGLQPWQAKKLYIDNIRPFGQTAPPPADAYTLELNTGQFNPALGMSYVQYAMQGLKHQLSQGAGSWSITPGPHLSYYRLVDSVLPMPAPGQHETDFFDGIDTTLPGLADRLGKEESKVRFLRPRLQKLSNDIDQATAAADRNPFDAAQPLLEGLATTRTLIHLVAQSSLSDIAKTELLTELHTKQEQFTQAANLALGASLTAEVNAPANGEGFTAIPGEVFSVHTVLQLPRDAANTQTIKVGEAQLDVPTGWQVRRSAPIGGKGGIFASDFTVVVPSNAPYTRPCIWRDNPEVDTVYSVLNDACAVLPLPPPPVHARITYYYKGLQGVITTPVEVNFVNGGQPSLRPLAVGPAFSVGLEPGTLVVPTARTQPVRVTLEAHSNLPRPANARIALEMPDGWTYQPRNLSAHFDGAGENKKFDFTLTPPANLAESRGEIKATLNYRGKNYGEGYSVVSRPDLGAALYYQPATARISAVDVKVPASLKVGYIMGAGDDIPTVLREVGMDVTLISPQELANGDLGKYGTIVVGIRAYDTREDVRASNRRLLDYVRNGGTLLVQYNAGVPDFNAGHYTPYSAELSHDRVTVEEAPVTILAPQDPVFSFPNRITQSDFNAWVQERGLYFMSGWAPQFEPLLACNDPGEAPAKGGLLKARYGKGTYIYTGYAFFRQLPEGVPGAVRLFVNLVSAGHEK
jgi:LmbE family N-acetylglucosaminyl deacetylase